MRHAQQADVADGEGRAPVQLGLQRVDGRGAKHAGAVPPRGAGGVGVRLLVAVVLEQVDLAVVAGAGAGGRQRGSEQEALVRRERVRGRLCWLLEPDGVDAVQICHCFCVL